MVASFMVWAHGRLVPHTNLVVVVVLGLLAVGVSWEVFEWFAKVPTEPGYVLDTALDVVMDVVGALLIIGIYTVWKRA